MLFTAIYCNLSVSPKGTASLSVYIRSISWRKTQGVIFYKKTTQKIPTSFILVSEVDFGSKLTAVKSELALCNLGHFGGKVFFFFLYALANFETYKTANFHSCFFCRLSNS